MKKTNIIYPLISLVVGLGVGFGWGNATPKESPTKTASTPVSIVELGELSDLRDASTLMLPAGTVIHGEWDKSGNVLHTSVVVSYEMNNKAIKQEWEVIPSSKKQNLILSQATALDAIKPIQDK
jgi:hypothetical protein